MPRSSYYWKNPKHHRKLQREHKGRKREKYRRDAKRRADRNREILTEFRKLPCADCGKSYPCHRVRTYLRRVGAL